MVAGRSCTALPGGLLAVLSPIPDDRAYWNRYRVERIAGRLRLVRGSPILCQRTRGDRLRTSEHGVLQDAADVPRTRLAHVPMDGRESGGGPLVHTTQSLTDHL